MHAAKTLTIWTGRKQVDVSSVTTHETLLRQSGVAKTAEHSGSCGGSKAVSVSVNVSGNDGRGAGADFKILGINRNL